MSFNIGVLNAAVTLDNSDFKRNAEEVPVSSLFPIFRKPVTNSTTFSRRFRQPPERWLML